MTRGRQRFPTGCGDSPLGGSSLQCRLTQTSPMVCDRIDSSSLGHLTKEAPGPDPDFATYQLCGLG